MERSRQQNPWQGSGRASWSVQGSQLKQGETQSLPTSSHLQTCACYGVRARTHIHYILEVFLPYNKFITIPNESIIIPILTVFSFTY